ncbi:MAG: alpha/beta hydrolase [Pseudomonadota bacterium]
MTDPARFRRAYPPAAHLSTWLAGDGWPLRRFDWPAAGAPRGSILFQGGRGDIIEKYLESFAHWHARGWSITAFDWRGQGGSGRLSPDRHVGHAKSFSPFLRDLAGFWADWSRTAPGPHVIAGHSMGGHLVLRALVEGVVTPQAAVLVAPMLGLHAPFGWMGLGERFARLLGGFGDSARAAWRDNEIPGAKSTRQALLTHDIDRYADEGFWKQAHPELQLGPPSWAWVIEAFRSTRILRDDKRLKRMAVPVLALVADADKLVNAKAAVATLQRLPDARVVRFGAESAHEILREADAVRNRALGEIDLFLASRAPQQ